MFNDKAYAAVKSEKHFATLFNQQAKLNSNTDEVSTLEYFTEFNLREDERFS